MYKKLQAQQEAVHKRDAAIKEMLAAVEASQEQQRQLQERLDSQLAVARHHVRDGGAARGLAYRAIIRRAWC